MENLTGQYIEISSEEEMEKALKWLESIGYKTDYDKIYYVTDTYLFININNKFHFNLGDKQSYWKPFSVLYDEGMPRDVIRDEETLLEKAKRLYPVGTRFYPAHVDKSSEHICIITEDTNLTQVTKNQITSKIGSYDWNTSGNPKYGKTSLNRIVYYHGKWAEIVEEESKPAIEVSLSEIQQYLPEGHPDLIVQPMLPNSATANKRIEELSYPDVIHIETQEDWDKVVKALKFSSCYNKSNKYYLIPQQGRDNFDGSSSKRSTYEGVAIKSNYTIYEMNQLIFPSIAVEKWSVGTYVVALRDKVVGISDFNKGCIARVISDGRIEFKNFLDNIWLCSSASEDGGYVKWFPTLSEAEAFAATLKKEDKKLESIQSPEYVEFTNNSNWFKKDEYEIGKIYKWSDLTNSLIGPYSLNKDWSKWTKEFKISSREAYLAQQSKDWEPQIGDWVVTDNLDTKNGGKYNGIIGQIWQIGGIGGEWYGPVQGMKFRGGSLKKHNLRKATQEEINSVLTSVRKYPVTPEECISKDMFEGYGSGPIEISTHQSINKKGKQFSPIKAELIKVKQLKIKN